MKNHLSRSLTLVLIGLLALSFVMCGDDKEEDKDCGKDKYKEMENNPAKHVPWIVELIENKGGKSGYIDQYKMDEKNYYTSNLFSGDYDNLKTSPLPTYIYDAEGKVCGHDPIRNLNDKEFMEKFHKDAVYVGWLWKKESCKDNYYGPYD